ncbi:Hypothetical_protein [Hexamita inflata]|uniref:Hypothetical_protein n=1 Tax=Hexamita inflata TaxID=28002 RepID=A0AA86TRR9_9EUKA|nr:Hypothetical protein HINF_LOCUS14279 [Hexamita inflata]
MLKILGQQFKFYCRVINIGVSLKVTIKTEQLLSLWQNIQLTRKHVLREINILSRECKLNFLKNKKSQNLKVEADALELNLNYWYTSRDTLEIITTFVSNNYLRTFLQQLLQNFRPVTNQELNEIKLLQLQQITMQIL